MSESMNPRVRARLPVRLPVASEEDPLKKRDEVTPAGPADLSAAQRSVLDAQQQHGNAYVLRMLSNRVSRDPKDKQASKPGVKSDPKDMHSVLTDPNVDIQTKVATLLAILLGNTESEVLAELKKLNTAKIPPKEKDVMLEQAKAEMQEESMLFQMVEATLRANNDALKAMAKNM